MEPKPSDETVQDFQLKDGVMGMDAFLEMLPCETAQDRQMKDTIRDMKEDHQKVDIVHACLMAMNTNVFQNKTYYKEEDNVAKMVKICDVFIMIIKHIPEEHQPRLLKEVKRLRINVLRVDLENTHPGYYEDMNNMDTQYVMVETLKRLFKK